MLEPPLVAPPGSPEELLARRLDPTRMPRHVAVIMDGNGRWAKARHLPRVEGHRAGVSSVRETVETAARLRLEVLTLYAFSVENWKRPRFEVRTLMGLLREYLRKELATLVRHDIRFQVIGRWRELEPAVVKELEAALTATRDCRGMTFNIALNYSGRCELVDACRRIAEARLAGELDEVDEATLARHLYTAGQPDPDLLIRTSGEQRISNFLLWQIAYAEIVVTRTLWPDFRAPDLIQAILDYQQRERRFGGVKDEEPLFAPGAVGA